MVTETDPTKIYSITNKFIDMFMQAMGIFAYVWLMLYLIVALIDK